MFAQHLIEYCSSNSIALLDLLGLEQRYAGLTVFEQECMSECTLCNEVAYAFYNGQLLSDDDPYTLLKLLESRIVLEEEVDS